MLHFLTVIYVTVYTKHGQNNALTLINDTNNEFIHSSVMIDEFVYTINSNKIKNKKLIKLTFFVSQKRRRQRLFSLYA